MAESQKSQTSKLQKTDTDKSELENPELSSVKEEKWGEIPEDNFGYASEEERKNKRGLEDWELVEKIPQSQKGVPKWFLAVIAAVLLVAIGLSFPFWGDRPGYERAWVDWGFGAALLYLLVFGIFVYFMVNKYSPNVDGSEDMDIPDMPSRKKASKQQEPSANKEEPSANKQESSTKK